jgi:Protein of unknown function (DUF2786)
METRDKTYETWEKCKRLSEDRSTTPHEREAAALKAKKLRARLDGKPEPDDDSFQKLVKEGQELVEKQTNINWQLGELARQVETKYGAGKLQEFAAEIGVAYSTLKNCRTTVRCWHQKDLRRSFSVCEALNGHPDRYKIVKNHPYLTYREAYAMAQQYRASEGKKQKRDDFI